MPPHAGQKRSATQNGEPSTSTKHASKKTRFVEPDDDPANFAEQVDASLEGPSRKGKVKTEGYESDSSDDGEGVVYSRKKGGADNDDDDDMFAMGEKEDKEEESGKKKEKFMRLGDIEGQEFNNDSAGEGSDDDDEELDEAALRKKNRDTMGFEISSFNMRDEMEEGKFTEDGNYIRTYDPHAAHDKWMEGLTDTEIKLARKRRREQEKKQKEKMEKEERELAESGGQPAIQMKLLPLLKKGESVLEALQRLGAQAKGKQPQKKPNKRKVDSDSNNAAAMPVDSTPKEPTPIELITQLASNLMSLGDADPYSKTYEELVRSVRSSGKVDQNWEPPSADVKYEYKWDVPGNEQGEVFGPFSEDDMKAWFKAQYFGTYGEKVQVRRVGGEWGSWDDVVES
ncbi:hypothetical protein CC1G_04179 [Coprinopsis cinerea okayama7|uniref:GYF domain-containing protein n=1 Tax=Coprinopsis cinerea (strain Okayama-7 / 130 / ATCC MYA-4618 / FGSC 9003) TaxID=240176 RepID=A8NF48_COPC7|nr:hypothetical protein CC1G_04179 [Coprinopsis cinerea okayama7\|eukprot:XP_001833200.2 hypothetical protein CC1G_04179 [Coprinopsis cinerea okayama7\